MTALEIDRKILKSQFRLRRWHELKLQVMIDKESDILDRLTKQSEEIAKCTIN